jgi:hypothetical protein
LVFGVAKARQRLSSYWEDSQSGVEPPIVKSLCFIVARRSEFGVLLETLLKERGLSARKFATIAKVSKSPIHLLLTGAKPVPAKRIDAWADALGLEGETRDRFVEEAWLTHCPDFIVKRYRAMKEA